MSAERLPKDTQQRTNLHQEQILEGFRLLFDHSSLPMWIYDCETLHFLSVNKAAIEHYGYLLAEFLQMRITDIRPPEDVPALLERLAVEQSGLRKAGQWRHWTKNGQVIDVEIVTHPLEFEGRSAKLVMIEDITSRKQMEAALRDSDAEFLKVAKAIPCPVFVSRLADGLILYANDHVSHIFGFSVEALLGCKAPSLYYDPNDRQIVMQALAEAGFLQDYEVQAKKADGTPFWVVVSIQYLNFDGEQAILSVFSDVTQRKQAEAALWQQNQRGRLTEEITQKIRQSLDLQETLNTTVVEVQQFFKSDRALIYRFQPDGCGAVIVESLAAPWLPLPKMVQAPLNPEEIQHFEQGGYRTVDDVLSASPVHYPDRLTQTQSKAYVAVPIVQGSLWGLLSVHQCSEPRVWQTWEVELLQQLANQLSIAIHQSELYQQVQQLNAELELQVEVRTGQLQLALEFEATLKRITDKVRESLDEDQILQVAVQELGHMAGVIGCDTGIYDAELTVLTIRHEYSALLPSIQGQTLKLAEYPEFHDSLLSIQCAQFCFIVPHPLRSICKKMAVLACPIVEAQGTIVGDLWLFKPREAYFNEIETRLVRQVANQCAIAIRQARLYQTSQAQVEELEKLHQLKDEFLSTVSHELRTPISNMKMAIHMLKLSPLPDRQQQYLEILQAQCTREAELINDLLDLQRLEADRYELSLETIVLQEWLPSVIEPFLIRAQQRQQSLQVEILPDLPAVLSDRNSLGRVLAELLNNACKYTPTKGEIGLSIGLDIAQDHPEIHTVRFTVYNQSEIPSTEMLRIFEKFYRVPNADPWKQGGTGLGLALVQKMVKQLGGEISVQSSDNRTVFTVLLPDAPLSKES